MSCRLCDSIKKASKRRGASWRKPEIGWNERKVLRRKFFSTSTPKPRAEGSIPSAPAIQRSETAWFRSFFGTFWAACFRQTADDAILTLKSYHPLPTIPSCFVRYSIKKASKHQLPRLGICHLRSRYIVLCGVIFAWVRVQIQP